MSDNRYDLDDILKEIDTRRGGEENGGGQYNESVTEIIDGSEIQRAIKTGVQRKKGASSVGKQKKPNLSVTQVINDVTRNKTARQFTEEESEERLSGDIERAMGNRKRPDGNRHGVSARQLTDEESDVRIARDIDKAIAERRRAGFGDFREEIKDFSREYDGDLGGIDDESDEDVKMYNPPVSDDGDIIFHTQGDLVTTDTMQMRKQKKIDDINEALLKIDSEANSPDDILDSLNPMESRAKAAEIIKSGEDGENTDTLAVAGNDLKRIGRGEEHIKEYHPASSRKHARFDEEEDEKASVRTPVFPAGIHVGETIVEALNKKIKEQENSDKEESDNIQVSVSEEPEPVNEELEKIKQANELAQKKKRRIANFILEHPDTEEIDSAGDYADDDDYEEEYPYDDDDESAIDLDDENVIRERLTRASKGLVSRLIILSILFAATLFIAICNTFSLSFPGLNKFISSRVATDNYIYTHLTIGVLSFAACSSVVSNGFSRLFKLRPDADTLCAFAHTGAIAAMIPYVINSEYIQIPGRSQVYLMVSLGALLANTVSKLFTVKTAQNNFSFAFGKKAKYFIEHCDSPDAERLAKGSVSGIPYVGSMRKTEMLCDFIISTYCEDASDRVCRKIVPITAAAAAVGAVCAFFTCADDTELVTNRVNWAITVFTAILALGASYCSSMAVTLPLLMSSRHNDKRGSAILGYAAVDEIADINAALVEAKTLFPAECIKITNICGYDKPKARGEGKVTIDEAIILAASLAVASDSVLADAFFGMLNNKRELLKEVSGCVYENNLGVMGWIERRRVLLGNRRHMKSHEITVPNMKKEAAANANNDEVIYLAVGGEVCLLFFVHLETRADIRKSVQELSDSGVSLVVKTVDGMITDAEVSDLFDIETGKVKILPFEAHETFLENTKFVSSGSAAVCCTGTFTSFAGAVRTAQTLRRKTTAAMLVQIGGIGLGTLLAVIFALFSNFGMFNMLILLGYNIITGAAAVGAALIVRERAS